MWWIIINHLFTTLKLKASMLQKWSNLTWFYFLHFKKECCVGDVAKEDITTKNRLTAAANWTQNEIATFSKRRRENRKDKQVFSQFKGASCNLFSIKLLINTRVALGSLSTLPHLQKIKDARFPCHCLPIEREPFPEWGDLGPLWLTWGHSINTQLKHSASQSLQEKPQITASFFWITHYAEMKSRD